jgi:dienelactone hydrolase
MLKSIKRTSGNLISAAMLAAAALGSISDNCDLRAEEPATMRTLDSHSPFMSPTDLKVWEQRADDVRLQLKVSLGIWPAPELDPVRPQIYGKIDRDDYTIEKVTFESLPGYFVTGNLYRPKNPPIDKPMPGILCPHGHWANARFYEAPAAEVKQLLASGAERYETAARNHIQARCVQLARMGCVVFHWDMLGYCDSLQINFDRGHRFGNQAADLEVKDDGWLLYSPMAESNCQTVPGLQTLATQRAVDFLLTMKEVDPKRIGITGASGGGTQSFLGAALDPRISLAFPAVMVSTGMQGGCTCENAPWLRCGTGNVEIAGLIAPRPLGMTAADDWTRTMPTDGFPELKKLYGLYKADKAVALFPSLHFGHNYNHVSRVSMYGWVSDHYGLGFEKPVLERDFKIAEKPELTVWDNEHPQPPGGDAFERKLMKLWAGNVNSLMQGWLRGDQSQRKHLVETLQGGWKVCLGLTSFDLMAATAELSDGGVWNVNGGKDGKWTLKETAAPQSLKITVTEQNAPDKILLSIAPVLFGSQWDGNNLVTAKEQPLVNNPRLAAGYTFGYNLPQFSTRARQLGATLSWLAAKYPDKAIHVIGTGADAALAAAGVVCAENINKGPVTNLALQIDAGGFRFAKATSIRDAHFLPGSVRFWDVPGLVACVQSTATVTDPSQAEFDALKSLRK